MAWRSKPRIPAADGWRLKTEGLMKGAGNIIRGLVILPPVLASVSCGDPECGRELVTVRELEPHIRFLSDDLLEGRAVGSRGIAVAEPYQEDLFRTFWLEAKSPTLLTMPMTP